MKKIVALLTLVPLAALGDVVSIRRVQRIGYEVFGGVNPVVILTVMVFGLVLVLLIAKRNVVRKMMGAVKSKFSNGWYEVIKHCAFFGLAVGVLCLLGGCGLLCRDWSSWMCFIGLLGAVFVVLCKVVIVLVRVCLRRKIFWRPWAIEMLIVFMSGCIFGCQLERSCNNKLVRSNKNIDDWFFHADNPGWKYPHEITTAERESINAKIASVKDELQARFDLEYKKLNSAGKLGMIELPKGAYVSARYRHDLIEGNSLRVVSSILEQDKLLCMRCLGVPIEWLAEAMRCPEPSYRSDLVKKTFPRAVRFQKDGNQSETKRIFKEK